MRKRDLERRQKRVSSKFAEHLSHEANPLNLVIRGHLYAEGELTALLEAKVKPIVLETLRPSFEEKLKLALVLELIPGEWAKPIRQLNYLRNRAAHKLFDDINPLDQDELFKTCAEAGLFNDTAVESPTQPNDSVPFPKLFSICIRTIVIHLGFRLEEVVTRTSVRYSLWWFD